MLEWIPVVFGSLLAMLHIRRALHQGTLSLLVCVCAFASAFIAGELDDAAFFVIVDAGLVVSGLVITLAVHVHLLRRRRHVESASAGHERLIHH